MHKKDWACTAGLTTALTAIWAAAATPVLQAGAQKLLTKRPKMTERAFGGNVA